MSKAILKALTALLSCAVGGMSLVAVQGCEKARPSVTKVSPEEARPGTTVTVAGKGLADKPEENVVKVGGTEAKVKSRGADSMVVEVPRQLKPGNYDLTVTDRGDKIISQPAKLQVLNEIIKVPAGTSLKVRAVDGISSSRNQAGDTFRLALDQPLVVNGKTVAGAGSEVVGRVIQADEAGRVKGRADLGFTLVELKPIQAKRPYPIVTDNYRTEARSTKKRDAATIGGGAGIGALIGALAGGKKGALIGAGIGGAAGTGVVLSTKGDEVGVGSGAHFTFRLRQPVEMEVSENQEVATSR